jgi:hypothetical protein
MEERKKIKKWKGQDDDEIQRSMCTDSSLH